MKSFLGGLGNLIIFLGELVLCGLLVVFLMLNPIEKKNAATGESNRKILASSGQSNDRGLDAVEKPGTRGWRNDSKISQFMDLGRTMAMSEWVPGFYAPAKLWGYDREYSSTDFLWVSGIWKTVNMSSYQTESGISLIR